MTIIENNNKGCSKCENKPGEIIEFVNDGRLIKVSNDYKIQQQRIWGTVRVPSSLYQGEKSSLNIIGTRGLSVFDNTPLSKYNFVNWDQSSDRAKPSFQENQFPSRGNSTKTTKTSLKPGVGPGGEGVDVKHNSYARYLGKLKGSNYSTYPKVFDDTPKRGNKNRTFNIINPDDEAACACVLNVDPGPGPEPGPGPGPGPEPGPDPPYPEICNCDFDDCDPYIDVDVGMTDYAIDFQYTPVNEVAVNFSSVSTNETGQYILATLWGKSFIYISKNYGESWIKRDVSLQENASNNPQGEDFHRSFEATSFFGRQAMVNGVVVRGDPTIVSPYVTLWSQPDDQRGDTRYFFLADVDEPFGGPPNYDGNQWQEQQFPGSNPFDYNPPLDFEVTSYDCTEDCDFGLITFSSQRADETQRAGTLYQGQIDLDEYKQVSPNVGGLAEFQVFRETTDIAVGKVSNMGTTVTPVNGDRNPNNTVIHLIQKGLADGSNRIAGEIPGWVVGFPQGVTDNAPTNFENDQVRWWGIIKLLEQNQGEWFDINLTDLAGQYAVAITTKGIITQVKLNTPVLDPTSPQAPSQYIVPPAQPPNNPDAGGVNRIEWINLCETKLEINLQNDINNETVIGFCAQRKEINELQSKIAIVTLPGKLYVGEVNTGAGYVNFKKTEFKIGDDYCATPQWQKVTINDSGDKLTAVGRYQNDVVIKTFNI